VYGQYRFGLSAETTRLLRLLRDWYTNREGPKSGFYFGLPQQCQLPQRQDGVKVTDDWDQQERAGGWASKLVADAFERACGERISVDYLRKLYVNHLASQGLLDYGVQRNEVARQMGNSVLQQQRDYIKRSLVDAARAGRAASEQAGGAGTEIAATEEVMGTDSPQAKRKRNLETEDATVTGPTNSPEGSPKRRRSPPWAESEGSSSSSLVNQRATQEEKAAMIRAMARFREEYNSTPAYAEKIASGVRPEDVKYEYPWSRMQTWEPLLARHDTKRINNWGNYLQKKERKHLGPISHVP